MMGGGRLRDGVVAGSRRVARSYVLDFEEAFPVSFVFGFFLLVPSEAGMFLLGLKTAQAWRSARARVGGALGDHDSGKWGSLGWRDLVLLVRDLVEDDRGVPASCGN